MYQRLLEHMSTAVLLLNDQLQLQWMNPAAEALLALSLARVRAQALLELIHVDETIGERLSQSLRERHPFTQREARLTLATGDTLTVDYTASPISEHELLLEVEPRDRLLRISREEALQARQETIKILTRGLAHEVKNPLGGIRGAAQLLERDLQDPAQAEFTHIIIEEVDRLRDLVDSMLGPNHVVRHSALNIHRVLEHVAVLLTAEYPCINIIRDYDPSLPALHGDESQLIQAILNIMRNAAQAMIEGTTEQPELVLRTRARRQFTLGAKRHRLVCKVAIIDNGPGISDGFGETLFYPMVSGRAEGSGLGLSIAQSILHQHHGLIEYESRPGHTEFRLLIPLETPHD
ncbi:nitrogen regulation protein NR(II) [Halomonas halocynthiae]|uniref:nitrogen regulation protein NR(II) n=1 Tax=Halomonas halocynthiae TaxID=176290 RepID=UPI000424287C|nr:nitrogen regulation protein NR(II) [Halomonas halocynthiae]